LRRPRSRRLARRYTVHVEVEGRRTVKLRERSEQAAAQRLAELAAAIERDGLAALG